MQEGNVGSSESRPYKPVLGEEGLERESQATTSNLSQKTHFICEGQEVIENLRHRVQNHHSKVVWNDSQECLLRRLDQVTSNQSY